MARFGHWKDTETGLILEGNVPFEFWPEDAKLHEMRWCWVRWCFWLVVIVICILGWS